MKEETYLGDLLRSLLSEMGQEELVELGRIADSWPEIAGERLSDRSEPVSFKDGRLVILTPAPVWTSEIHLSAAALIRRTEEITGIVIEEIKVKTGLFEKETPPQISKHEQEG